MKTTWIDGAKKAFEYERLLDELAYNSCDLRCLNVPTGGGDYDIEWVVIEHNMMSPKEREVGRGKSILKALSDAFDD